MDEAGTAPIPSGQTPDDATVSSAPETTAGLGASNRAFHYLPHARTRAVMEGTLQPPLKVSDQYFRAANRFNAKLGLRITNAVGTMACAYIFTIIALISLPSAIKTQSVIVIVSWIAQTFLQLVLLSIIMVGQNVQAQASDARAENTYKDAEAVLHEAIQIQAHLESQDLLIGQLLDEIGALKAQVGAAN